MKTNFIFSLSLMAMVCSTINAQEKKYPEPEPMKAGMTEYWIPQPKHVTPGDIKTNTAPSDAIVLFDGKDLSQWENSKGEPAEWNVHDGVVTVEKQKGDIRTKQKFGSFQMHLEWYVPKDNKEGKFLRGNSGVIIQGMYELQILDNYEIETYSNGYVASIYKQSAPLVNPIRKAGEWNVFDIIYTAPVFKEDGNYLYRPRITVIFNGVLVQNNTEILGTTRYIGLPQTVKHGDGPISLQAHGDAADPISFRNIWIRPL